MDEDALDETALDENAFDENWALDYLFDLMIHAAQVFIRLNTYREFIYVYILYCLAFSSLYIGLIVQICQK